MNMRDKRERERKKKKEERGGEGGKEKRGESVGSSWLGGDLSSKRSGYSTRA